MLHSSFKVPIYEQDPTSLRILHFSKPLVLPFYSTPYSLFITPVFLTLQSLSFFPVTYLSFTFKRACRHVRLTLAGWFNHIFSLFTSSARQEEKMRRKSFCVKTWAALTTCHHEQNRFKFVKTDLIYHQIIIIIKDSEKSKQN